MSAAAIFMVIGMECVAIADIEENLDTIVAYGTLPELTAVQEKLKRRDLSDDGNRYLLAYVNWRLAHRLPRNEKKNRKNLLKEAQTLLDGIVDHNAADAEALALRGAVIGDQITGAWSGMKLGSKSSADIENARRLDPGSPRAVLLAGISAFHTPATFGGGIDKSEEALNKAIERFQQLNGESETGQRWPNWGRVDAYVWLGQVYENTERLDLAVEMYEKALRLSPNHVWATQLRDNAQAALDQ